MFSRMFGVLISTCFAAVLVSTPAKACDIFAREPFAFFGLDKDTPLTQARFDSANRCVDIVLGGMGTAGFSEEAILDRFQKKRQFAAQLKNSMAQQNQRADLNRAVEGLIEIYGKNRPNGFDYRDINRFLQTFELEPGREAEGKLNALLMAMSPANIPAEFVKIFETFGPLMAGFKFREPSLLMGNDGKLLTASANAAYIRFMIRLFNDDDSRDGDFLGILLRDFSAFWKDYELWDDQPIFKWANMGNQVQERFSQVLLRNPKYMDRILAYHPEAKQYGNSHPKYYANLLTLESFPRAIFKAVIGLSDDGTLQHEFYFLNGLKILADYPDAWDFDNVAQAEFLVGRLSRFARRCKDQNFCSSTVKTSLEQIAESAIVKSGIREARQAVTRSIENAYLELETFKKEGDFSDRVKDGFQKNLEELRRDVANFAKIPMMKGVALRYNGFQNHEHGAPTFRRWANRVQNDPYLFIQLSLAPFTVKNLAEADAYLQGLYLIGYQYLNDNYSFTEDPKVSNVVLQGLALAAARFESLFNMNSVESLKSILSLRLYNERNFNGYDNIFYMLQRQDDDYCKELVGMNAEWMGLSKEIAQKRLDWLQKL